MSRPTYKVYCDSTTRTVPWRKRRAIDGQNHVQTIGCVIHHVGTDGQVADVETASEGLSCPTLHNCQAELLAVLKAAALLSGRPPGAVTIYTDNQPVAHGLNGTVPVPRQWIKEGLDQLTALLAGWEWKVEWIRRHRNREPHDLCETNHQNAYGPTAKV
jgi:ribonuclease HI